MLPIIFQFTDNALLLCIYLLGQILENVWTEHSNIKGIDIKLNQYIEQNSTWSMLLNDNFYNSVHSLHHQD